MTAVGSGIKKGEGKGRGEPREMSPSRGKVLRPQFNLPKALKKKVARTEGGQWQGPEAKERGEMPGSGRAHGMESLLHEFVLTSY